MSKKIQMYFITGFLGSGKTTLLNRLFDLLTDKKTGVIVNEFGQVGVDRALMPENDFDILELNNGQIFCTCLTGDFVKAVVSFKDLPVDYLLVETSGLANPNTLPPVLKAINDMAGDKIEYKGMLCVLNSVEFSDLIDVLKPVEEQVLRSDIVIINKVDLVDESGILEIEKLVKDLHPKVKLFRTSFCKVPPEILGFDKLKDIVSGKIPRRVTAKYSRPETYILKPNSPVSKERLEKFLEEIAPETYRMKGFIRIDGHIQYVDAVGRQIQIEAPTESANTQGNDLGLNIIVKTGKSIKEQVKESWKTHLGEGLVLE